MDSAISTAARALSVGDPLGALSFVALRQDGPALALRGIAMAQLGELKQARKLLLRAARTFGEAEKAAAARCVLAQAEVALALRDLQGAASGLAAAGALLAAKGDRENSAFAQLLDVRRLVLLGEVESATVRLDSVSLLGAPQRLVTLACLARADLAVKRADGAGARAAADEALVAATAAGIPALTSEVHALQRRLDAPIARLVCEAHERPVTLEELSAVFAADDFIVDTCRREIRAGNTVVPLVRRAVLLELVAHLAQSCPVAVSRETLIHRVFGARRINDSHRARLRVEMGRLRRLLGPIADVRAQPAGFALVPSPARRTAVLLPPDEAESSALLALLRGGEAWATSALSEALGKSQRAVQRALSALETEGWVKSNGKGRAQRWVAAPSTQVSTTLLLVAPGTLA